ncbi:ABC transporter permease [Chloroflexota bacterium]
MKWKRFGFYALQGLRNGGQRVIIAILSVAFGVMSVITMVILSQVISEGLLVDSRYQVGGDARLYRPEGLISPQQVEQIKALHAQGLIKRYALAETSHMLIMKVPGAGSVTFLRRGQGVDLTAYPLLGEVSLGIPNGANLAQVLADPGNVVITRDIADERHLQVGDAILVSNRLGGAPHEMRVAGIAVDTPAHEGGLIYYSLETVRQITGKPDLLTDIFVLWGNNPYAAQASLKESGWGMQTPGLLDANNKEIYSTFSFMLKGAGILGLLVGGIGIANTMQVLLARRKEEIAVLKTLGYSQRDLIGLFVLETFILGLVGSILGAILSTLLSFGLVKIAGDFVTIFLTWRFDLWISLAGLLTGVVTTVLFAANAILQASEVRPAALFRQAVGGKRSRAKTLVVVILLSLPFTAITSMIMGSLLQGIGILLIALAGLVGLGLFLGGVMWLVLRLLPTYKFHLLRLARNNMRRRGFTLVYAMIALFVGVFTLGFAIVIIFSSMDEYARRSFSIEGINLVVLSDPSMEGAIRSQLAQHPVEGVNVRYEASLESAALRLDESGELQELAVHGLQGRSAELWDITIDGLPWGSAPDGVYLPQDIVAPVGARIQVTGVNGRQKELTVAGVYTATEWEDGLLTRADGLLVSEDILLALSGENYYFIVAGSAPPDKLTEIRDAVGLALADTIVITSIDVDKIFSATLTNLLYFAVAMAGLALLAGAVLIANAVSLAMIERQYEIGILKAMGYSRRAVLLTVILEYGLTGAVASLSGLAGVEVIVFVLARVQEYSGQLITVSGFSAVLILLFGVAITALTALASAWRLVQVRPLVVLNRQA